MTLLNSLGKKMKHDNMQPNMVADTCKVYKCSSDEKSKANTFWTDRQTDGRIKIKFVLYFIMNNQYSI